MKLKICFLALLCTGLAYSAFSQATSDAEIDAVVTLLGVQKRQAVKELVNITPKDSVNFWKVYLAFEEDQKKYRKKRLMTYEKLVRSEEHTSELQSL